MLTVDGRHREGRPFAFVGCVDEARSSEIPPRNSQHTHSRQNCHSGIDLRMHGGLAGRQVEIGAGTRRDRFTRLRSGPLDPAGIAAAAGVVDVQVVDLWVGEEAVEQGAGIAVGHLRVQHHAAGVIGADGEEAALEHRR